MDGHRILNTAIAFLRLEPHDRRVMLRRRYWPDSRTRNKHQPASLRGCAYCQDPSVGRQIWTSGTLAAAKGTARSVRDRAFADLAEWNEVPGLMPRRQFTLSIGDLLLVLGISLLTSKGAHGVPGSAIVIFGGDAERRSVGPSHRPRPCHFGRLVCRNGARARQPHR
jgi:hypothetical protein